jgi:serine/threonine protein kinase
MDYIKDNFLNWLKKSDEKKFFSIYWEPNQRTTKEKKYILCQLLCGINYIHANGYAHRDIKPNNVLVNKNNEVKIIDFGISKKILDIKKEVNMYNMSDIEKMTGTENYTPRVSNVEYTNTEKTDMYSFGKMLFEAYVKPSHYRQFLDEKLLKSDITKFKKDINIKTVLVDLKYIKIDTIDLLTKCLEKNPEKRITSFSALKHKFFI